MVVDSSPRQVVRILETTHVKRSASWIAKLIFGLIAQWGCEALQGLTWRQNFQKPCFLFLLKNKCWCPTGPRVSPFFVM